MKKVYIIDGFNLIFRSFYAIRGLSRKDGFPTNALHGWIRSLWKLEDEPGVDRLVVVFDTGEDEFRKEILPEYKAQRKETPEELLQQIPVIRKMTEAMGLETVSTSGIEADDLIASMANKLAAGEAGEVRIVSADKDLAQCVREGIFLFLPPPSANPRKGWSLLDSEGVEKKFGVRPDQVADYLALIGDTSDNIPGLPGVGPKTAAKWLLQYGSLDGIMENAASLQPQRFQELVASQRELLEKNLQLTRLRGDLPIPEPEKHSGNFQELFDLLEEMEMKKALEDARQRYGTGQTEFGF
ncbi:MAG: 5'-3' exonuclease [Opitutales bacterium]|nr:5'-3' exonuclease [Opitutales bacterium]MCH8540887.1 5'-3' exonuclease [Opitutales bacterium]